MQTQINKNIEASNETFANGIPARVLIGIAGAFGIFLVITLIVVVLKLHPLFIPFIAFIPASVFAFMFLYTKEGFTAGEIVKSWWHQVKVGGVDFASAQNEELDEYLSNLEESGAYEE